MRLSSRCALLLSATLLFASGAHAQAFRAYIASGGNDANPCTLQAPCRLMPAALAAVANGGEIWMLDSANYNTGTVTITKSVSILAVPGAVGSLLAIADTPAISIPAAGLRVGLRNLVITNLTGNFGANSHGVRMDGASSVTIESSLLANLPGDGVRVIGGGTLKIVNSTLRDNGSRAVRLINGPTATIANTQMIGNGGGVLAGGNEAASTTVTIVDSLISGGFRGVSLGGDPVAGIHIRATIARSTIEGTDIGLLIQSTDPGSSSEADVGGSVIVNNLQAWGISDTGARILSLGNNLVSGNADPSQGTLTSLLPM
jgi:hypothetical protein